MRPQAPQVHSQAVVFQPDEEEALSETVFIERAIDALNDARESSEGEARRAAARAARSQPAARHTLSAQSPRYIPPPQSFSPPSYAPPSAPQPQMYYYAPPQAHAPPSSALSPGFTQPPPAAAISSQGHVAPPPPPRSLLAAAAAANARGGRVSVADLARAQALLR